MREVQEALKRVALELQGGNVGMAIAEMETYLAAWPQEQTLTRLQAVKSRYKELEASWREGTDAQLHELLYRQLLHQTYVIYANVALYQHLRQSPALAQINNRVRTAPRNWSLSAIRQEMEDFVSSVALLSLEPEAERQQKSNALYQEHQQRMNQLFDYVLTSRMWSDSVGDSFEQMLTSPTIDSIDQQLLVAAVTLSLLNQYDIVKFRLLTRIYSQSTDDAVRQRALVGWALAISEEMRQIYPEQEQMVAELLQQEQTCRELTELQMQLIYCLNEERDTNTIQQEIMPELAKSNVFRITPEGVEEGEEDPIEEMLNPDASEQRMERLESSFQRMMDMQKQGSDIYFGGFSQMKRFPFFYDVSNWFVPFYMQHPDIRQFVERMPGNKFIEKMMAVGPFCNSDKYSLVIAFQKVMERVPENMRKMLERGEATMGEVEPEELQSAAYMRRVYLMDLYRFFRIYPARSEYNNPFDTSRSEMGQCEFFSLWLFCDSPLEPFKDEVVRLLKRQKRETSAQQLLSTYGEGHRSVQYYIWTRQYQRALDMEPNNERALQGYARELFNQGRFGAAASVYDVLLRQQPERVSWQLNKAVCLVNDKKYSESLQLLFKLNYDQPDNANVNRVLAWALTCDGRWEQAERQYEQLTGSDDVQAVDWQNGAYCQWFAGNTEQAIVCFKRYVETAGGAEAAAPLFDEQLLRERGISELQMRLMRAAVLA